MPRQAGGASDDVQRACRVLGRGLGRHESVTARGQGQPGGVMALTELGRSPARRRQADCFIKGPQESACNAAVGSRSRPLGHGLPEVPVEPQESKAEPRVRSTGASVGNRRCAMRMLRDPDQGMILVYEMEPAPGLADAPSLVFETGSWCARLDHYPAEWRRMR